MSPAYAASAAAITNLAGPRFGPNIVACLIAVAAMRAALIAMGIDPDDLDMEVTA
jgi:hypothetical protein